MLGLKSMITQLLIFQNFHTQIQLLDRQSGFLSPTLINSSTHGLALICCLITMAISENKDFTFTPRLYGDGQNVIQNEYRQVNKNSKHILI